jgi:hypothetical protein
MWKECFQFDSTKHWNTEDFLWMLWFPPAITLHECEKALIDVALFQQHRFNND